MQNVMARKNPHAVALGRKGGKVGGKARTEAKAQAARANGKLGGRPTQAQRIARATKTSKAAAAKRREKA